MGRKKSSTAASAAITATRVPTQQFAVRENVTIKKLSQQKRNEINQLTDYLLKLGFDQTTGGLNELYAQYIEIQTNLQRLQVIESELKAKSFNGKNRMATIERFLEWARENGARFDGVGIKAFPNYELGLVAAGKDFSAGELFAIIPKRLLFTMENLSETVQNVMNQLPVLDTMPNVKLAFALVIERLNGGDSFWKPYIDMLPERYPTVMYFTPMELAELKGTTAFIMGLNQCKHVARQYAFIRKAIQNLPCKPDDTMMAVLKERFTYDLYCWAVSTMMTRQNDIPLNETNNNNNNDVDADGGNQAKSSSTASASKTTTATKEESVKVPALIPVWDVANHANGIITTDFNPDVGQIEGATMTDVKKDEQIFIYYGNRNNANLLIHNGFVMENNQSDSVVIRLGLSQSDPLVKQRTQLLENIGISTHSDTTTVLPAPRFISPALLAFVRIFNMNEDQLKHWLAPDKIADDLKYLDCALETELEIKTWTFLKMRITLLLRAFPTTMAEDLNLLKQHQKKGAQKLSHNKRMIIQYRIIEKRILSEALTYIEERCKP